jgi:hypothetical protein
MNFIAAAMPIDFQFFASVISKKLTYIAPLLGAAAFCPAGHSSICASARVAPFNNNYTPLKSGSRTFKRI